MIRFIDSQSDGIIILIILAVFLLLTLLQRMNRRDALHHVPAVQTLDNVLYAFAVLVAIGGIVAILLWR